MPFPFRKPSQVRAAGCNSSPWALCCLRLLAAGPQGWASPQPPAVLTHLLTLCFNLVQVGKEMEFHGFDDADAAVAVEKVRWKHAELCMPLCNV